MEMRAYLVRIGVDQVFGGWNAPMNPDTGEFVYVPIPESRPMSTVFQTPYTSIQPALDRFEIQHPAARPRHVRLPGHLISSNMIGHHDERLGLRVFPDRLVTGSAESGLTNV